MVLGVAWRLVRYALDFPVWGDEAMLALSVLDRDAAGLLEPLRFKQVAPPLFLLAEKGAGALLGYSALALRLVPLLASLLAVVAFGALARRVLDPLGAALATGVLAVSYFPVRHACEVKPYSLDLLGAALLLLLAARWLKGPRSRTAPILLVLLVPLATGLSYPSVFVAGAVCLALLPAVGRSEDARGRLLWVAFAVVLAGSFGAVQLVPGRAQAAEPYLRTYWAAAFPPGDPVALAGWLVTTHVGPILAHPWGGANAGSAATTLLCAAGLVVLARRRDRELLVLVLGPFALTLLAAVLRKYPYGGAPRLAQHLGPGVCLLVGAGLAELVRRFARSDAERRRAGVALAVGLCLFAAGGIVRDLVKPYKATGDRAASELVARLEREAPPPSVVVLAGGPAVPASVEYLFRVSRLDVRGVGPRPWTGPPPAAPRVVLLRFGRDPAPERAVLDDLAAREPSLVAGEPERLFFRFGWGHDPPVAAMLTTLQARGGG